MPLGLILALLLGCPKDDVGDTGTPSGTPSGTASGTSLSGVGTPVGPAAGTPGGVPSGTPVGSPPTTPLPTEFGLDYDGDGIPDGYFLHDNAAGGLGFDEAFAIAEDAQGRLVAAGSSWNGSSSDLAVWRLTPAGLPDPAFGGLGYVVHGNAAGGDGPDAGMDVVVAGGIRVVGESQGQQGLDLAVWAFDDGGALDPGFGTGGLFLHDSAAGGQGSDSGRAVWQDPAGGDLWIAGYSWDPQVPCSTVWHLSGSGVPVPTFGGAGWTWYQTGNWSQADGIAVDGNGRVMLAGKHFDGFAPSWDLALWAWNSAGDLDVSFGGSGFVAYSDAAGAGDDEGNTMILDSAGRLVIAGAWSGGGDIDLVVWRYLATGFIDPSFGNGGVVVIDDGTEDRGLGLVEDAAGRLVIAGTAHNGIDLDAALWRLNDDGSTDLSFHGGRFLWDSGRGDDRFRDVLERSDGSLIATGHFAGQNGIDTVVARISP